MKTPIVRHACLVLGLLLAAMLALACTDPSGGASGAPPDTSAPPAASAEPPKDDYEYGG